jgi:hypothetical protein
MIPTVRGSLGYLISWHGPCYDSDCGLVPRCAGCDVEFTVGAEPLIVFDGYRAVRAYHDECLPPGVARPAE